MTEARRPALVVPLRRGVPLKWPSFDQHVSRPSLVHTQFALGVPDRDGFVTGNDFDATVETFENGCSCVVKRAAA